MNENDIPTPDPNLFDPQEEGCLPPADNTPTTTPISNQLNPSPASIQQQPDTSEMLIVNKDDKPLGDYRQNSQMNILLFLLLISFFVSVFLGLLENAISLPSWMSSIVFFLIIACVAILMLVDGMRTSTPINAEDRRTLFKHFVLSISTVSLLAVLGSFLIVKEENLKKEGEELEKKQEEFNRQKNGQLTQLRIGFLPTGTFGQYRTRQFENALSDRLGHIPVSSVYPGSTYADTINAPWLRKMLKWDG